MKASNVKLGQCLPNGAMVVKIGMPDMRQGVVLAKNHMGEFVTWSFNDNDLSTTVSGHYFETLKAAHHDFNRRLMNMIGPTR